MGVGFGGSEVGKRRRVGVGAGRNRVGDGLSGLPTPDSGVRGSMHLLSPRAVSPRTAACRLALGLAILGGLVLPAGGRTPEAGLARGTGSEGAAAAYDPLATGSNPPSTQDFMINDAARPREIPVRVYLPTAPAPSPVILFSHGLGGSREGSAYLGRHWSARGYVAVFLQHPGSDDTVWQDVPRAERGTAMSRAASPQNLLLRVRDVTVVLDQLTAWQRQAGHPLAGRLDLARIGMSGHSFGALTTQAVSGQSLAAGGPRLTDARITAALPMSPSVPLRGDPAAHGWLHGSGARAILEAKDRWQFRYTDGGSRPSGGAP
jgi:dienelactone hydrolase